MVSIRLLDGIWGILKGSWGVLVYTPYLLWTVKNQLLLSWLIGPDWRPFVRLLTDTLRVQSTQSMFGFYTGNRNSDFGNVLIYSVFLYLDP